MKKNVLFVVALLTFAGCASLNRTPESAAKFYGTDSVRARMQFSSYMLYPIPDNYRNNLEGLKTSPLWTDIQWAVDEQLAYMFGIFTVYPGFVDSPGIPRNRPVMKFKQITKSNVPGYAQINYDFSDVVVFSTDRFDRKDEIQITFPLPKDPRTIYDAGIPDPARDCLNRCTDLHYNSEGDQFYFWNPMQNEAISADEHPDCQPYIKGKKVPCAYQPDRSRESRALYDKVVVEVTANLKKIPSTTKTYPEYDDLYKEGEMNITYVVGVDENFSVCDLGLRTYKEALLYLTAREDQVGQTLRIERDEATADKCEEAGLARDIEIKAFIGFTIVDNGKHDKRLTKTFTDKKTGKRVKVNIHMVLRNPNSKKFVDDAVFSMSGDAKFNADDIFIYDGHSGLGGYLSVERFTDNVGRKKRTFNLPKSQYQVFYFNGCSTYSYYNADYVQEKGGKFIDTSNIDDLKKDNSRYLDIITTGIGAEFGIGSGNDATLIYHLTSGERPSWQQIIDGIYESSAGGDASALTHINGDWDNPYTSSRGR
jgi:hypothetical protein